MNQQEYTWFKELTDLRRSLREALKNNNYDRIWTTKEYGEKGWKMSITNACCFARDTIFANFLR